MINYGLYLKLKLNLNYISIYIKIYLVNVYTNTYTITNVCFQFLKVFWRCALLLVGVAGIQEDRTVSCLPVFINN